MVSRLDNENGEGTIPPTGGGIQKRDEIRTSVHAAFSDWTDKTNGISLSMVSRISGKVLTLITKFVRYKKGDITCTPKGRKQTGITNLFI